MREESGDPRKGSQGERQEFEHEVSVGVWQGSTLSSATLRLTFWSRMADWSIEIHRGKLAAGFISCADDSMITTKQTNANATWHKTVAALKETGLKTDEAKSYCSREWTTEWGDETLKHKGNLVVLETDSTKWTSTMVDERDTTMAKERLHGAF